MTKCGLAVKTLIILGLIGISAYYTNQAILDWKESPTVTSASWVPLRRMKFPALTICPVQDSR